MEKHKSYSKKTILQVVPALVSGGVERGTIEIAKKLASSGYKSIIVSAGGLLADNLNEHGITHIKMNVATKNPFVVWNNAKKIAQVVREHKVDLIHARSRAPAWSCYLAAKATGRKFVTTFHGIYNFSSALKRYYNSIMTEGEIIIAVSNFVKDHIITNYGVDNSKIRVIHRGADHIYFNKDNLTKQTLDKYREKYRIPSDTPILLLPSRLTSWKGQLVLVEALNKIKDKNFYCMLVGDLSRHPAFVSRVSDLIATHKLQSKIQIFGNEPDILPLYGISDIVLSTSIEPEAFGRTIIEGQALEKLVIATSVGGAGETIADNVTGYHVTPGDADDLANKISYCMSIIGTPAAAEITRNARKSVVENFSIDRMLDKTLSVYNELIRK